MAKHCIFLVPYSRCVDCTRRENVGAGFIPARLAFKRKSERVVQSTKLRL